ncbi:MAG TPA: Lrp/AsnC family transcriptional regulator [Companilactobacillus farciminis]|uniref:Lrp/AsnC family transcriptional regulator n=1 Tax=Companilactobacillus farciminis TaxID=1612 RepID=A0A921HRM1_9LACO|nr:Lrp/AsnC family transcriptional regulator [Companilactobacillus farciminis]WCG34827.1 Lrp/AsnC family transcriptional regulator [Companilactobacillus farciminis]HJF87169.1 Lrp/AsnC family transcriptional regulator [Companilactobacillus farciminis]
MDNIDQKILKELNRNCRITKTELAKIVNMTPPAVNTRIEQLEASGIIKRYTIEVDLDKMGYTHQVFIETQMEYYSHEKYLQFIHSQRNSIRHHYKISGEMNYMIHGAFRSNDELNTFLEKLNKYANYKVLDVISELI